jgi:membrane fusion protein (multidrug efflux system)
MENQPKKKKPVLFIVLGIIILLVLFFSSKALYHSIYYETTDNAQIESNSTPVLSRIAGYIDSLTVSDYQDVHAGQFLLQIDQREYQIAVQQAEADLLTAEADLANARAVLNNTIISKRLSSANLDVQDVKLENAKQDFERDQALYKEGSITQRQYENSKANYETAYKQYLAGKEQVKLAGSQTGNSDAQIKRAMAMVKTRQAALENTKLKLSYSQIKAPVSGKLGKVSLHIGQFVQPGQPLFTIVDTARFWIVANFKETQLKNLKLGQVVDIKIDGYPDVDIKGKIASFSDATGAKFSLLPPDNATGNFVKVTQRVPVKIDLDNPSAVRKILKAGLSVKVDVHVK